MPYTALYENPQHALKPMSIALTLLIVIAGITLGSVLAVVLSWVWVMFAAIMLAVQALRLRLKSLGRRASRSTPVTIDGVYKVIKNPPQ